MVGHNIRYASETKSIDQRVLPYSKKEEKIPGDRKIEERF
jgi:hypothetical protein